MLSVPLFHYFPKKQKIQLLAATQLFSSSGSPTEIQGRICGLEVLRIGQKQEKSTTCNPMAAQALPGLDLESDTIIENKWMGSWALWIVIETQAGVDGSWVPSCGPIAWWCLYFLIDSVLQGKTPFVSQSAWKRSVQSELHEITQSQNPDPLPWIISRPAPTPESAGHTHQTLCE